MFVLWKDHTSTQIGSTEFEWYNGFHIPLSAKDGRDIEYILNYCNAGSVEQRRTIFFIVFRLYTKKVCKGL